ncbi:MAG: acyl-CoA dehydrogenase, partial [Myxococcota bacterium]
MQHYSAPIDDMMFQLDAFDYASVAKLERYEAFDLETARMFLEQTGSLAADVLLPSNRSGDTEGTKWDPETGDVSVASGYEAGHQALAENGFYGLTADPEHGGGGAPITLGTLAKEMLMSGNKSLSMCPGLTNGLIEAIEAFGSDAQKEEYLPKLAAGEWTGTMCLTEPHSGTDLGLLNTKAEVHGDHFKLTGTKIWITWGEHGLSDNIIHLVLARLPDAPAGIKGISTFIVPKFLPDGSKNGIACTGLEHKMGIHGSPTCVMSLENAEGWLIGEPNKGMRTMFIMMNAARLFTGLEGVSLAEIAYQAALSFAQERRQSRAMAMGKREQGQAADTILVHPDVRRMLLDVKSTTHALRGLSIFISANIDLSTAHPDETVRQEADDLVALMIPIMKAFGTERGFKNVSDAMQVCGGMGYTVDGEIEQYLRDLRIAMIYEGTNHIQALDLVGRKLGLSNGRLYKVFGKKLREAIAAGQGNDATKAFATTLGEMVGKLDEATLSLGKRASEDPEVMGASASTYLTAFGLVVCGFSL